MTISPSHIPHTKVLLHIGLAQQQVGFKICVFCTSATEKSCRREHDEMLNLTSLLAVSTSYYISFDLSSIDIGLK